MKIKEVKSRTQLLADDIDRLIETAKSELPKGTEFIVRSRNDTPEWKGIAGKYLSIGVIFDRDEVEV